MRPSFKILGGFFAILIGSQTSAIACSTCQCGDPSLTLFGTEKPFQGRTRLGAELRFRTEEVGATFSNQVRLKETRFTLSGSHTPFSWISVGASLPILHKEVTQTNDAKQRATGIGDMVIQSRIYLYGPLQRDTRNQFGLSAGSKFPTAPQHHGNSGAPLDIDTQPGTGAFVPQAGLWYTRFQYPFLGFASSVTHFATTGREGYKAGEAVVTTLMGQYHFNSKLAANLSFDSRWSARDRDASGVEQNSGGFFAFVTPGIVYSPKTDFLIQASVQIPTINALYGDHTEGFNFFGGVTYDL